MKVIPPIVINDANFTSSNIPEPDAGEYPEYSNVTAYVPGNKITVSTVEPDIHENFECVANTTGNPPWLDDAGTYWVSLGPTNRWAMFREGIAPQSTYADEIDITITPSGLVNALALINISAASVQVTVTDSVEGVVYDKTISMTSTSGITDWYAWYFTPIERRTDLVLLDLPAYFGAAIRIRAFDSGSDVKIGSVVVGNQKTIGTANHGTSVGTRNYSTKETDVFGNFVIVKRPFSKRAQYAVTMDTDRTDFIQNYLASIRDIASVWIGSESLGATIVYGFYKDFDIILSTPTVSSCNLQVEGLTQ